MKPLKELILRDTMPLPASNASRSDAGRRGRGSSILGDILAKDE